MISKTGKQAINAILRLAALPEGEFAGAKDIAKETGAPQNYLGKLLQLLSRHGLLLSQKGANGGFRLARKADKITLSDVVEPIDHISRRAGCIMGQSECTDENACALHNRWKSVRDTYIAFLNETTLADLIASGRAGK